MPARLLPMNTPLPTYRCPACSAAFEQASNFCGVCGAGMATTRAASTSGATGEWNAGRERRTSGPDPWLGRIVDQRYRVTEVLGRGGMGVVYKVTHQRMGKVAAMKVLHRELAADPEVIHRFRREAEAISRLTHPNSVQVFDFGTADDAMYLVMEYVRGADLGSLIKRDGPMKFARAAPIVAQICTALAEAHELGVIHRDLKPENIIVTRTHRGRDFVKVLDYGLAKLSEREEAAEVTDRGSIVGTPYFMSPEQIRGEDVDRRTDIYSLGAVMYRLLTGHHPFTAKTPVGVLTKHLTAELVPPSQRRPDLGIAPAVDAIVAKAMAKDRSKRYSRALELIDALEGLWEDHAGSDASLTLHGLSAAGRRRTSNGGLPSDVVDYGIDSSVRLQRRDLDAYERSLRRRQTLRMAIVPLVVGLAAASVIYQLVLRPRSVHSREVEPNDEPAAATLIGAATPVSGFLGRRISVREPDRDYYELRLPDAAGMQLASVHLTALPNADLELTLFNALGRQLASANEGGIGQDEWLHNVRTRGRLYVLVTESPRGRSKLPTENVSDAYQLTVQLAEPAAGLEAEPNASRADATPIAANTVVTGYLDARQDIDTFRFTGAAGRYQLRLDGADVVPIEWRVDDGERRRDRVRPIALRTGAAIELRRRDDDLPITQALPGLDVPYALQLTPFPDP